MSDGGMGPFKDFASIGLRDPADRTVTFLPDPEPAERRFLVISVDDHVVEPPHLFEGRLPAAFEDRAPRVVSKDDGREVWVYEGEEIPNVGMTAVVGRPPSEWSMEPTRFDEMRRGAWDIKERVRDMDLNGIYASVNFPSFLAGFSGQRLQLGRDPDFGLALVRAYNDWHLEEWSQSFPDRIIPCQLPWLLDPVVAAEEIRRNAERGFKAVTFSEGPHRLGLPSLHTGYWDPFFAACEETETVVCLHIGSSSSAPTAAPDSPPDVIAVLFGFVAVTTTADWLYSMIPVRFPGLKIALSEGGIGWVPALLDRLDHLYRYGQHVYDIWRGVEPTPAEVIQRNFRFCALDDPSAFAVLDRIGVENVLLEVDYPHPDGTWPFTQELLATQLAGLSDDVIERLTWRNASELYRHPVPQHVLDDFASY